MTSITLTDPHHRRRELLLGTAALLVVLVGFAFGLDWSGGSTGAGGGVIADGAHTGFVTGVDPGGVVSFDSARVLDGDEARRAALAAGDLQPGEDLDGDFYVDNPEAAAAPLAVSAEAVVRLYDCTSGCVLVTVPTAAFLDGTARPFGGERAMFEITVVDGTIAALSEVYLP